MKNKVPNHTHPDTYLWGTANSLLLLLDYSFDVKCHTSVAQLAVVNPISLTHISNNLIKRNKQEMKAPEGPSRAPPPLEICGCKKIRGKTMIFDHFSSLDPSEWICSALTHSRERAREK